jgi:hypothetical protein
LAVLILIGITVAAYGRVCGHEFTWWDDQMTLHHNARYNPPSAEGIRETWTHSVDGLYAPVTYSYWGTLAFVAELKETSPQGIHLDARVFHTGSLILHVISVLVAFAILKALSENVPASAGGALLFAIHPVQVETVAWASGAKDLLCGLLSLLAIYQYVQFARLARAHTAAPPDDVAAHARRRRQIRTAYGSGALLLVLAMLSKPSAMVVPTVVAAIDLFVIGRPWRDVAKSAGGWLLVVIPFAVIARISQDTALLPHVAIWQRPFIAADAIAFYLWKLVWPVALTPDYARRPEVVLKMLGGAWPYLVVLVPAAVAAWAWRGRVTRPWVLAGLAILVIAVGPVLGLTPFMFQYTTTVADHYLYFGMFGPALVLTWALVRYRHRALIGACAMVLALLAVRSNDQLAYWRNDRTLWTHGAAVAPGSFVARTNLAADLSRKADLLNQRASALDEAGQPEAAAKLQGDRRRLLERSVVYLEEAIALQPKFMAARHNAWVSYLFLGQHAKAAEHLEAQIAFSETNPDPEGRAKLRPFYASAAGMWMKAGRYDRAIPDFEKALRIKSDDEEATQGLAEARAKLAEAQLDLDKRE